MVWIGRLLLILAALLPVLASTENNSVHDGEQCDGVSLALKQEIASYRGIANRIIQEIVYGKFKGVTHSSLERFTDEFGPRMSGSQNLEEAIDNVASQMSDDGLRVYTEAAQVPVWIRGREEAELLLPHYSRLTILGLGSSVGTNGSITADAVVVKDFEEFVKLPASTVAGKIVVFAQTYVSYPVTVAYRARGASVAAKKGAVAALINSVTPMSLGTPHTGHQSYEDGVRQIPAACITAEDAQRLLRLSRRGIRIQIRMRMDDYNNGTAMSRNLIGELVGREQQNTSVVVVSGHLDSWDVGVGAMDDGGGAFIARYAATFLSQMGLVPRRTIRAIQWTAEEQGIIGAARYREHHRAHEKEEFNFFIESDMGTFDPLGLDFSGNEQAKCIFNEVLKLLAPLNATKTGSPQDAGPDIDLWTNDHFPGASLMNANERYFWYHHSAADSMILERPENLDKGAAIFAVAAYVIADLSVDIPKDV